MTELQLFASQSLCTTNGNIGRMYGIIIREGTQSGGERCEKAHCPNLGIRTGSMVQLGTDGGLSTKFRHLARSDMAACPTHATRGLELGGVSNWDMFG
jgi:hypothetical protein